MGPDSAKPTRPSFEIDVGSRLHAVIFDFDGTLADSYDAIAASVNYVRGRHGHPPLEVLQVRAWVGRGTQFLLKHTVPSVNLDTALAEYMEHHPKVLRSGTRLLPGVRETLTVLQLSGLELGVCSNKAKPFTLSLLDILDIARFFKAVVGPEDAALAKPAPDMLLAALKALARLPEEALYIGDMTVDVETARAAKVQVWAIATGSNDARALAAAAPDRLIVDFRELMVLAKHGA
jgi:phosphoglycolate phosphatase